MQAKSSPTHKVPSLAEQPFLPPYLLSLPPSVRSAVRQSVRKRGRQPPRGSNSSRAALPAADWPDERGRLENVIKSRRCAGAWLGGDILEVGKDCQAKGGSFRMTSGRTFFEYRAAGAAAIL